MAGGRGLKLSLMIDGEALQFGICEIFHAKPHVLTAAEKKTPILPRDGTIN